MVEISDRMWSTGEGKPLQHSCIENPMNSMRRQNDRILKEKLPRPIGAQYATGDQWRNNSRKNEGMEPKQKQSTSCKELTHWKGPDTGRDWGQEEKGMTEDEMAGWHHRLDGHEFE